MGELEYKLAVAKEAQRRKKSKTEHDADKVAKLQLQLAEIKVALLGGVFLREESCCFLA